MTKLNNTSSKACQQTRTDRPRKTKCLSSEDKWNPNKPFHVTQEEFWEHIHEIERGPFTPLDEGFRQFEQWKAEFLKSKL